MNNRRGSNSSFDRKWAMERFQEPKAYRLMMKDRRRWWQRRPYFAGLGALVILGLYRRFLGPPADIRPSQQSKSSLVRIDNSPPEEYCQHFDGVLWISQGDRNGAAGTIFFLFIMNQLLYAEKYNLQPFIHLNDYSRHVYDDNFHRHWTTLYKIAGTKKPAWKVYVDSLVNKTFEYPGPPQFSPETNKNAEILSLQGTGVWNSYFETTIQMKVGMDQRIFNVNMDRPCPNLSLIHLDTDAQLVRGLHLNCPYCVRSWKYGGVPPSLKMPNNYQEWWKPMRQTGNRMIKSYYHAKPEVQELAQKANPLKGNTKCLAMHIRHSDKANKREKIPLSAFLPYCEAYVEEGGQVIYLATDSSTIVHKVQTQWPPDVVARIRWQKGAFRSPNETAVFDAILNAPGKSHHHRTNLEVLVDIMAMAKCHWFLHGLSAVSEATFYWNADLHQNSVNLEFYQFYQRRPSMSQQDTSLDAPMSIDTFRQMLHQVNVAE